MVCGNNLNQTPGFIEENSGKLGGIGGGLGAGQMHFHGNLLMVMEKGTAGTGFLFRVVHRRLEISSGVLKSHPLGRHPSGTSAGGLEPISDHREPIVCAIRNVQRRANLACLVPYH